MVLLLCGDSFALPTYPKERLRVCVCVCFRVRGYIGCQLCVAPYSEKASSNRRLQLASLTTTLIVLLLLLLLPRCWHATTFHVHAERLVIIFLFFFVNNSESLPLRVQRLSTSHAQDAFDIMAVRTKFYFLVGLPCVCLPPISRIVIFRVGGR